MSKLPSDATQLRNLKSNYRQLIKDFQLLRSERDSYRVRATKAEQEASEWKKRFDILLTRDKEA